MADRGVDAALGLGHGHPLDAVGARLVLEAAPRVVARDLEDDLVEAVALARALLEDVEPVAPQRGVALVHLVEVACEEVRLLAALRAADLDDHRAPGVRVVGEQQLLELRLEGSDLVL